MNDNNRLINWAALTAFSIVSLTSMTNSFEDGQDWVREQKWAISVASISLIVSALSFFFRLFMMEMFTEKWNRSEHTMSFVSLVMWSAGLPNINNSESSLAIGEDGKIMNYNLFFSSWLAFITSMMLFADLIPSTFMKDRVSTFTNHWMGFGTASLIVLTNAVWYWRDHCNSTDDNHMCHRDLFAFVLGAVSGLIAITFFMFPFEMLEQAFTLLFCAAWCFAIAYLTFDDGPATDIGAFYFSVWFSFMFSLWMAVHSIATVYGKKAGAADAEVKEESGGQEATAKQDVEDQEKEEVAKEGDA